MIDDLPEYEDAAMDTSPEPACEWDVVAESSWELIAESAPQGERSHHAG